MQPKEINMITTICYGQKETFKTRKAAIESFEEAIDGCDPRSSECSRYVSIVQQLRAGATVASDEDI
jgi:hypothetical protein